MFVRYRTDEKGRSIPIANVYSNKEHPIRNSMIDKDALWAIRKLQQNGHEAYVVGGSVRDLLLGKKPKDFDIATSATPRQTQRLFWNSRIIGKRFRIVHLFFGEKIIETTTFRSDEENFEEGNNNIYGSIEQDARRRDFSINALYYNPQTGQILDFCNGMQDFKRKVIRSLIPLKYSFTEDPVRMIRAIKYSVTTGFELKWSIRSSIKKNAQEIARCSTSRLTEEVMKILSSGYSAGIFTELYRYKILQHLLPCFSLYVMYPEVQAELMRLDQKARKAKAENISLERDVMIYHLIKAALVLDKIEDMSSDELYKDLYRQSKVILSPVTPPNYQVEKAVNQILTDYGIQTQKAKKPVIQNAKKKAAPRFVSKKSLKAKPGSVAVKTKLEASAEPMSLAESHDL